MSLLGQGFLPSRPTDGEFVRHKSERQASTELRDLKKVIKDFFDVSMNLDTGLLDEKAIPISSLPVMSPDPTGVYQKMTVDVKGRFVDGTEDEPFRFPRLMRVYYFGDVGLDSKIDTDSGPKTVVGRDDVAPGGFFNRSAYPHSEPFKLRQFLFTVPKDVFRINYTITGGPIVNPTQVYGDPIKHGPASRVGSLLVEPSDILRVWVGMDGKSPSRVSNFDQSVYVDSSEYQKPPEKADAKGVYVSSWAGWTESFGGLNKPSLVILEWYG